MGTYHLKTQFELYTIANLAPVTKVVSRNHTMMMPLKQPRPKELTPLSPPPKKKKKLWHSFSLIQIKLRDSTKW